METEGSLPCSVETVACFHPESDESCLCLHIHFKIYINVIPPPVCRSSMWSFIIIRLDYKSHEAFYCVVFCSFLLLPLPPIIISTKFSNILSLCSFLNVRTKDYIHTNSSQNYSFVYCNLHVFT